MTHFPCRISVDFSTVSFSIGTLLAHEISPPLTYQEVAPLLHPSFVSSRTTARNDGLEVAQLRISRVSCTDVLCALRPARNPKALLVGLILYLSDENSRSRV